MKMIENLAFFNEPYEYFVADNFLPQETFALVQESIPDLKWVEAKSIEYLKDNSTHDSTGHVIARLQGTAFDIFSSDYFMQYINQQFDTKVTRLSNVIFLKMHTGFFNHIHSDENSFGELVRILLYISNPDEYTGGEVLLHHNSSAESPFISYKFSANALFGFKMCTESYHSVREVTSGQRICLSMTYS